MSAKPDIIFFSVTRWDQPNPGSSVSIVRELSKTHRVFFVERPYSLKDIFLDYGTFALRKRLKALLFRKSPFLKVNTGFSSFVVATPGLCLPVNFLPAGFLYKLFNSYNNFVVQLCINRMIREYGIRDFIFLNYFFPTLLPVFPGRFRKPLVNIYYITNDIRLSKYFFKHGGRAEEEAISKADLILVSSRHQFKRLFSRSIHMYYFPNAVDHNFFDRDRFLNAPKPYDLINIGDTKVIMYCGFLSSIRIDYQLLKIVCEAFPQYLIVIIGTYEEADLIKYKLEQVPNLIILGNRRYESIPAYLNCAHVTLIPYLCNELNKSVYPLKLNEYLAMGKPVVTTHFSSDLDSFSDVIYISSSYEDFLNNIEKAMNEDAAGNRVEERIKIARLNTWENRVRQLEQIITKFQSENR